MPVSNIMIKTNKSITSLKTWLQWHVFLSVPKHYNPYSGTFAGRASLSTHPTTDCNPYSSNLAGHASLLTCPITRVFQKLLFSQKLLRFWAYFNTLIPSHWIEVDIERLLFSLAVKMPNFWGPKIDKKVINSSTKCLISVKIAILTPHIIPPPWWMFGWYLICRNEICQLIFCVFGSQSMLSKSTRLLYGSTASCRSIQCCLLPNQYPNSHKCTSTNWFLRPAELWIEPGTPGLKDKPASEKAKRGLLCLVYNTNTLILCDNMHERCLFSRLIFNHLYISIPKITYHKQEGQHSNGTSLALKIQETQRFCQ